MGLQRDSGKPDDSRRAVGHEGNPAMTLAVATRNHRRHRKGRDRVPRGEAGAKRIAVRLEKRVREIAVRRGIGWPQPSRHALHDLLPTW
jgi:hypothetical protein